MFPERLYKPGVPAGAYLYGDGMMRIVANIASKTPKVIRAKIIDLLTILHPSPKELGGL